MHRTGAPDQHARWIFNPTHRVRAVLDSKKGFGEHPRGLFPGRKPIPEK